MKSLLKTFCLLLAMTIVYIPARAQHKTSTSVPGWVPGKGYWVAESNLGKPKQHTIYFYNDHHVLIYKERIEGVRLDLQSQQVKMRLKKVLESSLLAWRDQQRPKENEGLVINLLQGK